MTALVAALLGIALVAVFEFVLYTRQVALDRRTAELRRRISAVAADATPGEREALLRRARLARSATLEALLRRIVPAVRLERLIEQADVEVTVAQILGSSAGLFLAVLFFALVARRAALVVVAAGLALVPTLWLIAVRAQRNRHLSQQLPEALEMMSRSLRAGHALAAAFENVAREMPAPVSVEFARAFEEQRLGLDFDEAVRRIAARCPSNSDVKLFAISAVIQRETGGNLAHILDKIAALIRDRFRFQGKLRALTAEGRTSAVVLGALPFLMALLLAVLSPRYITQLFVDPMGNAILAFGVVSWAVGQFVLFRLSRVDI
ncbi:MAG TPA: type II secretion system F family protein [Anaeromyxobacter sp.]|nr:type II secretion system F family protein [Anaeromyxobacter sp.]